MHIENLDFFKLNLFGVVVSYVVILLLSSVLLILFLFI